MLTRLGLARRIAQHARQQLYDDSGATPIGIAIYSLADPRDLRLTRYIGQTGAPRRRFLQHMNTARLWLPDETPWWVRQPTLRPLYEWLRELHSQERRLPTMIIHSWIATPRQARLAERARICAALANQLPLFNVEREFLGRQLPLI
ncbi:MAG TPA: hypothetical protein VGV09_08290 [Steroidobacteraceae bacterium]|nr:hypothetical protein [Steroidobacteraceae bacterium]